MQRLGILSIRTDMSPIPNSITITPPSQVLST